MAVIVGVHGIAQQLKGPAQLRDEWTPALSDGLRLARADLPRDGLECAFYGDLFRQKGSIRAAAAHYRAEDVTDEDVELLFQLWEEAAISDRDVVSPDASVRGGTPKGGRVRPDDGRGQALEDRRLRDPVRGEVQAVQIRFLVGRLTR